MKSNQWYSINDISLFVESSRVLVYSAFGENHSELDELNINISSLDKEEKTELDECLPQQECMLIAKDFLVPSKNCKISKISEKKYKAFIDSLNARMVSNMLNKLSHDGFLESAFDEESNDFIFWVKENENKKENS
jgi:hypothetical protein